MTKRRIDFSLRGVGKVFSGISVLRGVDLEIMGGEIHALMGENGAGKSTLVKIISGVHSASAGTMHIDGELVRFDTPRDAEHHGIVIMHQELSLIPDMTVAENVMLGREPLRWGCVIDRGTLRETARAALAQFGFSIDIDTPVRELRVGEQQLVEIARALLMDARLLIMDEPTSALSQTEVDILLEVVRDLALRGVAVVYISHRMDEIFALADRVSVLRDGDLIGSKRTSEATATELIEMMVGRPVEVRRIHRRSPPTDEIALAVANLTASAGGRVVLDDVSLSLRRGEVLGVGGLLGSGRTELLETLFGARGGGHSGQVEIEGRPVKITSPARGVAAGLALITEDRKAKGLLLNRDIGDNVILPLLPRVSRFAIRSEARKQKEATRAIGQLHIASWGPEQVVGSLSGGNQQKVVLGKWLATDPRILLLDEPTRGIDVGAKDEIYEFIGKLADDGMSILFASSEIPEFLAVCDRVMVLCEGRVTGILDAEALSFDAIRDLAMQFSDD